MGIPCVDKILFGEVLVGLVVRGVPTWSAMGGENAEGRRRPPRLQDALTLANHQQGVPRGAPAAARITEFSGWSIVRQ